MFSPPAEVSGVVRYTVAAMKPTFATALAPLALAIAAPSYNIPPPADYPSLTPTPANASGSSQTPTFSFNQLWDLNLKFLDNFIYPADIVQARAINSTLLSEDILGRIDITRTFKGRELNTEYLFGLFANLASASPGAISLLGIPLSYEIVQFAANQNIVSSVTRFQFNFTALSLVVPLEISGWNTYNARGEISQYDAVFKNWQWAVDELLLGAGRQFGTNSTQSTIRALQKAIAKSICGTSQKYCKGENAQYQSESECLGFLTRMVRFGAAYELGSSLSFVPEGLGRVQGVANVWISHAGKNTLLCRMVHQNMVPYRPEVHCPHVGKEGGGYCVDDKGYEKTVREDFFTNSPYFLAMATKDTTHDISRIDHHVKDVETLARVLNQALCAAFPKTSQSRYKQVHVLLLSWEDDDLGVVTEIAELQRVFDFSYHFQTSHWELPSHKSHNALVRRVMQLLDESESGEKLLIVYYGGHGKMNEDRQCVWICNQQANAATLQWSSIQTMLEEADSDVLILLDCCAAGSSAGGSGKGITQLIAACGFESFAPGVGKHSFTRALIEELKYYNLRGPVSTAFLHNKILARVMKAWNPRYASDGTQERRRTPIYVDLSGQARPRCIELSPLPIPPSAPSSPSLEDPSNAPSSAASTPECKTGESSIDSKSHLSPLSEVFPDPTFKSPKVLVSIALAEAQTYRTEDWIDWLTSTPAAASIVHVEGISESNSTLVLLALPVAIWDLLPRVPSISFIAFVRSRNLAPASPYMLRRMIQKRRLEKSTSKAENKNPHK
ncbi:MAG: hypothetical protein Q9173_006169 [Seirophora scorigena]